MLLGSLYCKQYGPRSDCSQTSSLIRVHIVCLHDKVKSEVNLNIRSRGYYSKIRHFQGNNIGRPRVKAIWDCPYSILSGLGSKFLNYDEFLSLKIFYITLQTLLKCSSAFRLHLLCRRPEVFMIP